MASSTDERFSECLVFSAFRINTRQPPEILFTNIFHYYTIYNYYKLNISIDLFESVQNYTLKKHTIYLMCLRNDYGGLEGI